VKNRFDFQKNERKNDRPLTGKAGRKRNVPDRLSLLCAGFSRPATENGAPNTRAVFSFFLSPATAPKTGKSAELNGDCPIDRKADRFLSLETKVFIWLRFKELPPLPHRIKKLGKLVRCLIAI
jgi:hypothetical protein